MEFPNRRESWTDFENRGFNEDTNRIHIGSGGGSSSAEPLTLRSSDDDMHSAPNSAGSTGKRLSLPNISSAMKNNDLKMWLASYHLSEYYDTLVVNHIDLDLMGYMTKNDIKELIPIVGDRIRLWKAIRDLPLNRLSFDEPLSSTSITQSLPSSGTTPGSETSVEVRFHTDDEKKIPVSVRYSDHIESMIFQAAGLPANRSYILHDGFDYFHTEEALRQAIFKKQVYDVWATLRDNSSDVGGSSSDNLTLTLDSAKPSPNIGAEDRPTSLEVTRRLSEFFPGSNHELLEAGLRNSALINRRFSTVSGGWRSSFRSSRRFSTLTISDAASATEVGTAVTQTVTPIQLPLTESTELDTEFLERLDNEDMSPTEWYEGKLIGNGSFGSVHLAFILFTGDIVAVKKVQLLQKDQRQRKMVDAMHQEIRLLRGLEHPNIVQYRGFKSERGFLHIFLEYIPGGSLASKVANYGALKEDTVRKYIKQCLSGLAYLHDRGIIHRDIKGANILVDTNDQVKISDFGLSKHEDAAKQRYSMQGTAFWMAPEVARAREQTTTKADIWSLGCLIIELVTGQHPFPRLQAFQAIYKIGKGSIPDIPENISADLKDLLMKCLSIDPKERPDAYELLKHPFFNEE